MKHITLTGKTLPEVYVRSYFDAWISTYGRGSVSSSLYIGVHEAEEAPELRTKWLYPLFEYKSPLPNAKKPIGNLDYALLAMLYRGALGNYGFDRIARISLRVGRIWWNPCDIWENHNQPKTDLSYLLGDAIEAELNSNTNTDILFRGLAAFAAVFSKSTGIPIHAQRQDTQTQVIIPYCPFCNNDSQCYLFHGVLDGYLKWYLGKYATASVLEDFLKLHTGKYSQLQEFSIYKQNTEAHKITYSLT